MAGRGDQGCKRLVACDHALSFRAGPLDDGNDGRALLRFALDLGAGDIGIEGRQGFADQVVVGGYLGGQLDGLPIKVGVEEADMTSCP
jgi:hypothetical protein